MRSIVLVFLGACSYGILSTFVKIAYDRGFFVGEVTGSQMTMGALMIWLIALFYPSDKKAAAKPSIKQWLSLLAVGTTLGLTGVLYYNALIYIPASIAIILLFQFTWIGVLIESVLNRKWPNKISLFALLFLLIGTCFAGGLFESGTLKWHWLGTMFGLLSAVSYSLFIICSGRVATQISSIKRSAIMITGGLILTLSVFPPVFMVNGALWNGLFVWGFLLALFGAVIPTLFYTIGIPQIGGGLASILSAAELPTAVFMSSIVLREYVSLLQWLGVIVVLLGIALPEIVSRLRKQP